MTKIAIKGRLALDDMQGTWEKSRETLVASLGDLQDGVVTAVNGGLSSENTTSTHENYVLTHNTTIRIKNPLSVPCVGIWAVRCVGLEVSGGKPTRKLYALSKPEIDWEPADSADDTLLVTARFPAPEGSISLLRSTAQSIAHNVTTQSVSWSSSVYATGALSYSTDTITCAKAGIVQAQYSSLFDTAAGGRRQWWLSHASTNRAENITPVADNYVAASGADEVSVAAGDTIKLFAFQDRTAATALDLLANRTRMQARYVAPPIGTTGKVTLFFYGG